MQHWSVRRKKRESRSCSCKNSFKCSAGSAAHKTSTLSTVVRTDLTSLSLQICPPTQQRPISVCCNFHPRRRLMTTWRSAFFGCACICCSEDRRTASVIALPPGVECLTVDREYETAFLSPLSFSISLSQSNEWNEEAGCEKIALFRFSLLLPSLPFPRTHLRPSVFYLAPVSISLVVFSSKAVTPARTGARQWQRKVVKAVHQHCLLCMWSRISQYVGNATVFSWISCCLVVVLGLGLDLVFGWFVLCARVSIPVSISQMAASLETITYATWLIGCALHAVSAARFTYDGSMWCLLRRSEKRKLSKQPSEIRNN